MSALGAERVMHPSRNRQGVALPAALGAVALLAALSVAAVAAAREELRAARALEAGLRARSAAEGAVMRELAVWEPTRNVRLALGATDVTAPAGVGTPTVRTLRAGLRAFVLDGRATAAASPAGSGRDATRRVRLLVRLRSLAAAVQGAVVTAGPLHVAAGATVDGSDLPAPGWVDCSTWEALPADAAAVAVPDAASVRADSGGIGRGGVRTVAEAGLPASHYRFDEESWATLAARAAVLVAGGSTITPGPRADGGRCVAEATGWGEPRRGADAVGPCEAVSPIVHVRGDVVLRGPARGQGVLLVDGDLRVEGEVDYAGLVLVRGAVRAGAGALRVRGTLMIANAEGRGASELGPGSVVAYSSCAVARAAIAAARPVPVGRRAWSEVTR